MEALLRCATLCSKSHWKVNSNVELVELFIEWNNVFQNDNDKTPLPKRDVIGDASEAAIMKYCELIGGQARSFPQF